MERRSFLQAIMAISAGTIVSPAMAGAVGGGSRYQRLITAQHRTIIATQAFHANGQVVYANGGTSVLYGLGSTVSLEYQRVVEEGQATLRILNEDFAGEPKDHDLAQANVYLLINGYRKVDTMSEQELRGVEDVVANVAVIRSLLQRHAAPINGHHFPEWGALCVRVRPYMLGQLSERASALVQPFRDARVMPNPAGWTPRKIVIK